MIKVLRHGSRRRLQNPATLEWQEVINVQFIEFGRTGANLAMSGSSDALSRAVGVEVGIPQVRVHTHPVLAETIEKFPVGMEFPTLFLNRKMFSIPQMPQQAVVEARMIEGKPTYFTTEIATKPEPDIDLRMDSNVLARIAPNHFRGSRVGTANTETIENVPIPRISAGLSAIIGEG